MEAAHTHLGGVEIQKRRHNSNLYILIDYVDSPPGE